MVLVVTDVHQFFSQTEFEIRYKSLRIYTCVFKLIICMCTVLNRSKITISNPIKGTHWPIYRHTHTYFYVLSYFFLLSLLLLHSCRKLKRFTVLGRILNLNRSQISINDNVKIYEKILFSGVQLRHKGGNLDRKWLPREVLKFGYDCFEFFRFFADQLPP
jgi:hypothetical protein